MNSKEMAGKASNMKMSSSLKEKLRKTSRYSLSPVTSSTALLSTTKPVTYSPSSSGDHCQDAKTSPDLNKTPKPSPSSSECSKNEDQAFTHSTLVKRNSPCTVSPVTPITRSASIDPKTILLEVIKEKEETVEKLRRVKMYRTKNDAQQIESLIEKWRQVVQDALQDLHKKLPEPKMSLTQLINYLQIDHTTIKYNSTTEDFET